MKSQEDERDEKIKIIAKKIDILWQLYDDDRNGNLTSEQAKQLFKDIFEVMGQHIDDEQVTEIIRHVDENEDNRISKEEFKDLLLEDL